MLDRLLDRLLNRSRSYPYPQRYPHYDYPPYGYDDDDDDKKYKKYKRSKKYKYAKGSHHDRRGGLVGQVKRLLDRLD